MCNRWKARQPCRSDDADMSLEGVKRRGSSVARARQLTVRRVDKICGTDVEAHGEHNLAASAISFDTAPLHNLEVAPQLALV